jgi:gamma-glutamyltranspeptidase/glutathione hydrolase
VDPVSFPYRDLVVYELPPPTQGLAAAGMLVRLEAGVPFKAARNAGYALRDRYITDPDFSPTPVEPFLDATHVAAGKGAAREGGDTVYLCAADEHGNLVSMIQSVAFDFGSGVVAEGTGMLLQNRGAYFSLDPSHVNRLEPKKRTMHTLIPAMAARGGKPWAAFGSMGGDLQPQLQAQVLMNLVDHGLDPAEAVTRPRKAILADGVTLAIEADYPGAAEIARQDANVLLMPPRHHSFGHAHAIVVDGPAAWRGGADPRSDGSVEYVR